jgi:hypothetical protein
VISPTVNFKVDGTADIGGTWTTPTTPFGWTAYACAHKHRWQSEDPSTRCPNCGTTTFKEVV